MPEGTGAIIQMAVKKTDQAFKLAVKVPVDSTMYDALDSLRSLRALNKIAHFFEGSDLNISVLRGKWLGQVLPQLDNQAVSTHTSHGTHSASS